MRVSKGDERKIAHPPAGAGLLSDRPPEGHLVIAYPSPRAQLGRDSADQRHQQNRNKRETTRQRQLEMSAPSSILRSNASVSPSSPWLL